ncbi:MAG: DNA polymerase III subunit gamma/tau [Phycisphaerales bacterium]|nr:DNA polymerase III subunit gamma/tau [Phycisphaerales bacterium]
MSYTVLARRYRSQTFEDLVGQEAIATTLKNAVTLGRVHHGYLFTGTRGVGKTSTARLLAKALNCLNSDKPTPKPCCACDACRLIAEGEDLDVIEIDAASNTGVDDIRLLRENAAYRPARSRYKVYIIDEVHMLSTNAFNALLKTLEEPPEHVKFILATTEIQKVPATITSRCQRFDFKRIGVDAIAGQLSSILKQEGLEADDAVIRRVARLADGSMRDALSLLDQVVASSGGQLTVAALEDILPSPHDEAVAALIDQVADGNAAGALACVDRAYTNGQTADRLCELLIGHLRTLMLMNVCGADSELVDVASNVRDAMTSQAGRFDAPTFVYMIGLMEETRRSVKSSVMSRALVDAAVVRLAFAEKFTEIEALIARLDAQSDGAAVTESTSSTKMGNRRSAASTERGGETPAVRPAPRAETPVSSSVTMPSRGTASGGHSAVKEKATGGPAAAAPRLDSTAGSTPGARPTVGRSVSPAPSKRPSPTPSMTSGTKPSRGAATTQPVSSADEVRVRKNPVVRQALDLFDGTVVSVQRTVRTEEVIPAADDPSAASPEDDSNQDAAGESETGET